MVFNNIPGPPERRHDKPVEPIFHPHLRRTKEVIRRPEWVQRSGEAVVHRGSLSMIALFGIVFSNCVGGGYGFEDSIGAAGPLITLIVCAALPWIWCMPTGLAVAELSTAVPSNSGVLMWINAAFPPLLSFMCILATLFITFIGNATYPNLTAEYVATITSLNTIGLIGVKAAVIVLCCVLNCMGVEIVGSSSIIVCVVTSMPFCLLTLIQLFGHGFNRAVLHTEFKSTNWSSFFSIISWNYANIENAGAVVEEVANPKRAFPTAMILLMLSTYMAYVMPMLAGVSCLGVDQDYTQWRAGHWTDVAKIMAGPWLQYLLFAGSLVSSIGFTLTSLCCTSRLLAGMGTMHMFPRRMSRFIGYYHPKLGTPILAIMVNSAVTMLFSATLNFDNVVALCQSLYCLRLVMIYGAVITLRVRYPNLLRPYALPCNTWTAAACLTPAALFSVFASVVSAMTSLAIGVSFAAFIVLGSGLSWVYCRVFAPNGFQGVIVQCAVTDSDEDKPCHQDNNNNNNDNNNDNNDNNNSDMSNVGGHANSISSSDNKNNNATSQTDGSGSVRAIDSVRRRSVAAGTDDLYPDEIGYRHSNDSKNNNSRKHKPAHLRSMHVDSAGQRGIAAVHSARQHGDPVSASSGDKGEDAHGDHTREGSTEAQANPTQPHAEQHFINVHAYADSNRASSRRRRGDHVSQTHCEDTEKEQQQQHLEESNSHSSSNRAVHVHIDSNAGQFWRRGHVGTQERLDEGVFYADPGADAAEDILLGILPLRDECESHGHGPEEEENCSNKYS